MVLQYCNADKIAELPIGNLVVDTSALATRVANDLVHRAERGDVYLSDTTVQEIRRIARSNGHSEKGKQKIRTFGRELLTRVSQEHTVPISKYCPVLEDAQHILPKACAYTGVEPYLDIIYSRCKRLAFYLASQNRPLTLSHLRGAGKTRTLQRIIGAAKNHGTRKFAKLHKRVSDKLYEQYAKNLTCRLEPYRKNIVSLSLEQDLVEAYAQQVNALWMRVLGEVIVGGSPNAVRARGSSYTASTADKSVVQLGIDLCTWNGSCSVVANDVDIEHYLWIFNGIKGDGPSSK